VVAQPGFRPMGHRAQGPRSLSGTQRRRRDRTRRSCTGRVSSRRV
jgi:hypothetical protein